MNATLRPGSWEHDLSKLCFSETAAYPKAGEAIIFYGQFASGLPDEDALHAGCPVIEGEKWAANLWVWNKPVPGTPDANDAPYNMVLTFVLDLSAWKYARIYWVPPNAASGSDNTLIGELNERTLELSTRTFDGHRFDVLVGTPDSREVHWIPLTAIKADLKHPGADGVVQVWRIGKKGIALQTKGSGPSSSDPQVGKDEL